MFSCLLPRNDGLHKSAKDVNALVIENTKKLQNVHLITHDNLFDVTENKHINLLHDKKHLNRDGTTMFARNLTRSIYRDTGLKNPAFTRQHQSRASRPIPPQSPAIHAANLPYRRPYNVVTAQAIQRYPGQTTAERIIDNAHPQRVASQNTNMQISLQLTPSQLNAIRQHAFSR